MDTRSTFSTMVTPSKVRRCGDWMSRLLAIGVLLLVVSAAPNAHAQADLVTTRALSMGEARRAISTGADAVIYNPAGLALVRGYAIEAMYAIGIEDLGHRVHVSIADSITSRV